MENKKSQEEMFRIKNTYSAKYGMEMDEWSAVILCEIEDNFKGLNKSLNGSTKEIEQAATFIKGQVKPIYFSSEKQAYKYGLSSRFYPFLTTIIGILLMWIAYCIFGLQKEEKASLKLFNNLIQNRQIITEKGELKLVLNHKNKKDIKYGAYYEYDRKKNVITVPLVLKKDVQIDSTEFNLIERALNVFK